MQSLFDPVISEITRLVSQQVNEAKAKKDATIHVRPPVRNVILGSDTELMIALAHHSCRRIC
jgi:hypothetical protein